MNDPKPEIPPIKQTIIDTQSVVAQTWEDLDDLGKVIDDTAGDVDSMKKVLRRLYKNQVRLESEVKKTIATEVEKQIKPLVDQLDSFITQKPRFIYIKPKLPSLNMFRFVYNRFKQ